MTQAEAAKSAMIEWLSDPHELGKKPAKIECTKVFSHNGMAYYIFKFKKGLFDKTWLLAVCGGYEDGGIEHCGHIFSDYKAYSSATEVEDATQIIERIRAYWMNQAKAFPQ